MTAFFFHIHNVVADRALLEELPVHVQHHAVDVVCGVCCAQLVARQTSTCSLESSLTRRTKVCIPVSVPATQKLLLLPSTKLVSTFDFLELSDCDKLCKQGPHFSRSSLCFLPSGALPHKEGGVGGMETITTAAAHRGVMATGRRPTQFATPRRRCRARTHSSLRVQRSCSGHGSTCNKKLIDKREHGCGKGASLCTVAWDEVQVETWGEDTGTCKRGDDLRHTFHLRTFLARRVQRFSPARF